MPIVFRCEECGQRYRVPDDKAGKKAKCKKCQASLTVPAAGFEETAGGSRVFRHQSRERDFDVAVGDSENINAISEHVEELIGPIDGVFHELVSDLVHIDVHHVKASRERPFHTLFTTGMSDRPMNAPEELEGDWRHAELMLYLPPHWPMTQESWNDETNYWPIRLLKMLARFPHEYDTWLGEGHTIPNGDPPLPYDPSTKLLCALLMVPFIEPEEFWLLETDDGKIIRFFMLMPLYGEEMNFKLQRGNEELLDRFDKHRVSPVILPDRLNVCKKKFGLF